MVDISIAPSWEDNLIVPKIVKSLEDRIDAATKLLVDSDAANALLIKQKQTEIKLCSAIIEDIANIVSAKYDEEVTNG